MSDAQALQGPTQFPPDQQWMWQGDQWTNAGFGARVSMRVFGASGAYFPSPGVSFVQVECVGGGGAGGGAQVLATAAGFAWIVGGGGVASGSYSRSMINAAQLRGGVMVTIGAAGQPVPGGDGGPGGTTSFGAMVVASGGGGGLANVIDPSGQESGAWGAGGSPGAIGVGDLGNNIGTFGHTGCTETYNTAGPYAVHMDESGAGAPGPFGGGAEPNRMFGYGTAGTATLAYGLGGSSDGSGGSGGMALGNAAATGATPGGVGTKGVVIVTEYVIPNPGFGPRPPFPPGPPGPWRPWSEEG